MNLLRFSIHEVIIKMDKIKMEAEMYLPDCTVRFCTFFRNKTKFDFSSETYEEYVLFCVESGEFICRIGDGAPMTVREGQIVLCPPHTPLAREMVRSSSFCMLKLLTEGTPGAPWVRSVSPRRLYEDLATLADVHFLRDFSAHGTAVHFCRDLWYLFLSAECGEESAAERAAACLVRRMTEEVSVAALAADAGYSTAHFINLFRRRWGVTPKQYQLMLRMRRAEELLSGTAMPVAEIAQACGFADAYYFSRLFHRHRGVTPLGFRAQTRV